MNRVELLSPAGDLEKLKMAFLYGADAVYAGGKNFSLRARASNFTLDDIKEGASFAKKLNKKLYITMNIVAHEEDLNELVEYLKFLEEVGVTGIIASSMYILNVARKYAPKLEVHISTQTSVLNSEAVKYYASSGATRVVLGREASIEEIKMISKNIEGYYSNTNPSKQIELECFIHGGMCSSFSGRCMLSNYLTNRDANRGGCAHSCRWNYDLYENEEKLNNNSYFNIGSKDLCALNELQRLIAIGVDSLKIEGRMKSEYYIAKVIGAYRGAIDAIYKAKNRRVDLSAYLKEIQKAENRETSTGFLEGDVLVEGQLYDRCDHPTKEFVGTVISYNIFTRIATIRQRNFFKVGDTIEFFGPKLKSRELVINNIYDEEMRPLDAARHPEQIIKLKVPFRLRKVDMLRLKINLEK